MPTGKPRRASLSGPASSASSAKGDAISDNGDTGNPNSNPNPNPNPNFNPCSPFVVDRMEAEDEAPRILSVLALVLERLVSRNEKCFQSSSSSSSSSSLQAPAQKLSIFHGLRPPSISVGKYLERIYKYTNCSPSCLVVAFIFIDRLVHCQPHLPVVSLNVHRLIVTSVLVAAKILDDIHYNNAFFARVGGVSNTELNRLELELLFQLEFRVHVDLHIFESYCSHLEREMLVYGHKIDRVLPSPVYIDDPPETTPENHARQWEAKPMDKSMYTMPVSRVPRISQEYFFQPSC